LNGKIVLSLFISNKYLLIDRFINVYEIGDTHHKIYLTHMISRGVHASSYIVTLNLG